MKISFKLIVLAASIFLFVRASFKNPHVPEVYSKSTAPADSTIQTDPNTGLKLDQGLDLVIAHCTGCHSSKLITQFHTDRNGWLEKIRWMQQKQKLWDLGTAEPIILDYLAKNYPPSEKINRRKKLEITNWYFLKN